MVAGPPAATAVTIIVKKSLHAPKLPIVGLERSLQSDALQFQNSCFRPDIQPKKRRPPCRGGRRGIGMMLAGLLLRLLRLEAAEELARCGCGRVDGRGDAVERRSTRGLHRPRRSRRCPAVASSASGTTSVVGPSCEVVAVRHLERRGATGGDRQAVEVQHQVAAAFADGWQAADAHRRPDWPRRAGRPGRLSRRRHWHRRRRARTEVPVLPRCR